MIRSNQEQENFLTDVQKREIRMIKAFEAIFTLVREEQKDGTTLGLAQSGVRLVEAMNWIQRHFNTEMKIRKTIDQDFGEVYRDMSKYRRMYEVGVGERIQMRQKIQKLETRIMQLKNESSLLRDAVGRGRTKEPGLHGQQLEGEQKE